MVNLRGLLASPLEESSTFVSLSLKGEGEEILERGFAPLKLPHIINPEQREILKESQREAKLLLHNQSPFPLSRGRGTKGDGVTK